MATTEIHHTKSHDDAIDESSAGGIPGLRSVSFDTITSSTTAVPKQDFMALTRTNLHEKHSDASAAATATTSTASNSIKHIMSLRDSRKEDNLFVASTKTLHQKHSREKYASNPDELPEIWTGTTSTVVMSAANEAAIQEVDGGAGDVSDEISQVNPAPEYSGNTDSFGNTFDSSSPEQQGNTLMNASIEKVNTAPETSLEDSSNTTPCYLPSIEGASQKLTSFGSHSSKNSGIVLRYRYELVQDLTGVDWTINSKGERDGTDYLVESILPEVEQEILGDVIVPTLFDECKKRELRKLLNSGVIGVDMKPDDFPLPQTGAFDTINNSLFLFQSLTKLSDCFTLECISNYVPQDPLKSIQCHRIEGAMTLYFAQSSPYTALLPSITLQALNGIKERMNDGSLLSSHDSILALEFLDSSYSLAPVVPMDEPAADMKNTQSPRGNGGLAAGLVIFFLVLASILGYFAWIKYKESAQTDDTAEHERNISVSIHDDANSKESISEDSDDDESYTSSDSETSGPGSVNTNEDAGDESDTDSDGIFEDDDSIDPEDLSSAYGNIYKKKKATKTKNNIVINGMADETSVATGATGLHSEASQRTVKMKNVVLPNILDVDINMR